MFKTRCCLVPLLLTCTALAAWSQEPPPADTFGFQSEPLNRTYRARKAVVIGAGYKDSGNSARLELPNAENDAAALAACLKDLYGFDVDALIGSQATKANIDHELDALSTATAEDCVLVFFAGHCQRGEGAAAVLLANDVSFVGGKLHTNYLRVEEDIIRKLKSSPARHKLLVLDACHSGTIFELLSGLAPSKVDDRKAEQLFQRPAFQGMASAMTTQTASDGKQGQHSPFCDALLKGLRHLPARQLLYRRERFPEAIPVTELFRFIAPELAVLPYGQKADLRTLEGEGEFTFFPRKDQEEFFASQSPQLDERLVLQAAMTSERGDWWFQEMPWFIPSLRQKILAGVGATRNPRPAALIDRESLKRLTESFLTEHSERTSFDDLLHQANLLPLAADSPAVAAPARPDAAAFRESLRKRHARRLLEAETKSRFTEELGEIIAELELARSELRKHQADLEAHDLHLLAVLRHALARDLKGKQAAIAAYEDALQTYQAGHSPAAAASLKNVALLAICKADYAWFLAQAMSDYSQASKRYREADSIFGNEAPPPFRISILCRSAEAKLAQNRFLEADELLAEAKRVADGFTKDHPLNANVHRTTAWARMIQWRIKDAQTEFELSKGILAKVLRQEAQAGRLAADQSPKLPPADAAAAGGELNMREILLASSNYQAKVAYFHNQHGLAMVRRFLGEPEAAASDYRELAALIEDAIAALRDAAGDVPADTEHWLFDRLVNTLERLGDCNLFGDPAVRDLREAADDYRRALSLVNRIQRNSRDRTRAQLLYKQALAICLSDPSGLSDRRDTALALQICGQADHLFAGMKTRAGLLGSLGWLAPKVVKLIDAADAPGTDSHRLATLALRQAILDFRDEEGPYLHRDQVEMCLLSAKVLLELGHDKDAFHRQQDRALLLGFCRQALAPYCGNEEAGGKDTRKYLRPYYDAAMRVGVHQQPVPVKDLLEVHSEATTGRRYVKPPKAVAALAIYVLDGRSVFLLDLPRGGCACVQGGDDQKPSDIAEALAAGKPQLRLPAQIEELLVQWRRPAAGQSEEIDCRWHDPLLGDLALQGPGRAANAGEIAATTTQKLVVSDRFPFVLPRGFREKATPVSP
jgi:hypothetical protein